MKNRFPSLLDNISRYYIYGLCGALTAALSLIAIYFFLSVDPRIGLFDPMFYIVILVEFLPLWILETFIATSIFIFIRKREWESKLRLVVATTNIGVSIPFFALLVVFLGFIFLLLSLIVSAPSSG